MAEKEITATGPNGEKVVLRDGQWVPMTSDAAPRALPRMPTAAAAAQDKEIRQGLRTAAGTFVANLLSTPHAAGELLAAGGALPALIPGGRTFSEARAAGEKQFPASALLAFPDPTTEDVLAVPGAIARTFSNVNANAQRARTLWRDPKAEVGPVQPPQIGKTFAESLLEEKRRSEASPIATGAGRVGGDVATLLAMRPGQRVSDAMKLGPFNPRSIIPADTKKLDAAARLLARGLGRSAEAGFEGAVISALGDGDPVKTAAYSAGIQAGGSAALMAKSAMLRNPVKTFGALWLGHQMFKAVAPGPQQAFESSDTAIKELIAAYGLGTVAAMLGAGRGVGEGNIRQITDTMSTASRGAVASVITQLQEANKSGNTTPDRVLELMGANPDHFGSAARERLERAASSEEPRALLDEIDALMQNEGFRKALEETQPSDTEAQPSFANWLMRR